MSTTPATRTDSGFSVGSLVVALLVWAFVLTFFLMSFDFGPRSRILPQIVGGPLLLAASLSLIREVRVVLLHRRASLGARAAGEDPAETSSPKAILVVFGWVFGAAAAMVLLGFIVGSAVFLVFFLRIYGRERWLVVIALPAVLISVVEIGFVEFFGYSVIQGYLFELLEYQISFVDN